MKIYQDLPTGVFWTPLNLQEAIYKHLLEGLGIYSYIYIYMQLCNAMYVFIAIKPSPGFRMGSLPGFRASGSVRRSPARCAGKKRGWL